MTAATFEENNNKRNMDYKQSVIQQPPPPSSSNDPKIQARDFLDSNELILIWNSYSGDYE
jgi:hypothetical protein